LANYISCFSSWSPFSSSARTFNPLLEVILEKGNIKLQREKQALANKNRLVKCVSLVPVNRHCIAEENRILSMQKLQSCSPRTKGAREKKVVRGHPLHEILQHAKSLAGTEEKNYLLQTKYTKFEVVQCKTPLKK
jgi:hypothetical protein